MTRPCSNNLRERVVRAHLAGEPICWVAARYRVLDVAHAQAASQHLHREILQSFAPPLQMRPDLRTERLLAARGAVVFTIPSAVFNRPVRLQ